MADDFGFQPVQQQPSAQQPDNFGFQPIPKAPDMSGVEKMAQDNLAANDNKETSENQMSLPQTPAQRLDTAMGMPVTLQNGDAKPLPATHRSALIDAYKAGTAIDAGDLFQSALRSVLPIIAGGFHWAEAMGRVVEAGGEGIGEGYEGGAVFPTPISSNIETILGGAGNIPFRALSSMYGAYQHAAIQIGEEIGAPALGRDLALAPEALVGSEGARPHAPETPLTPQQALPWENLPGHETMQEIVGKATGKPPAQVMPNDIDQAIRMAFENRAPKAQDFKDVATVMNADEGTLHGIYKETGVSPDKVHEDALGDPKIAADVASGKTPEAYDALKEKSQDVFTNDVAEALSRPKESTSPYSDLSVKIGTMDKEMRDLKLSLLNEKMEKGIITPKEMAEREIITEKSAQEASRDAATKYVRIADTISSENAGEVNESLQKHIDDITRKDKEIHDALSAAIPAEVSGIEQSGEAGRKQPPEDVVNPQSAKSNKSRNKTGAKSAAEPAFINESANNGIGENAVNGAAESGSGLTPEHRELQDKLGVPETMSASQLGKLDKKIGGIFANRGQEGLPKASELTDAQFNALEDYARRIESARENVQTQPIAKQVRNIISDEAGSLSIPQNAKDFTADIKRDVLSFTTPMEIGSERARASAKDFANKMRFSQWNGARIVNMLKEQFTPVEMKDMWEAMDAASVYAQKLESSGMSREEAMLQTERDNIGHFALPEEQKQIIKSMSDWAQHSWDAAKKLGMVQGDGLPFWTPRMAAAIGEDGAWRTPGSEGERPSVGVGKNLRTTSGNLKQRKYLTAEETESAMKKAFGGEEGERAMLVRDIRAMPLAMTRLEQAIAGRSMVNEIKEMSKDTGAKTVVEKPKQGYFTLDHPALQTYRPRLELNDEGKWELQNDAEGNPIFDKHPVYISKEFEGPLKAVLSQDSSAAYKALMALKGKSMSLIMYSPVIHNAVEWGRALPAMPGKVATFRIYFEGNRVKNDPVQMQEAINAGLVPIGSRFFNQDISSIIEQPNLTPGRSWTAKLLGGITGEVNAKAGEAVKTAIDKMGDVWHNTLLWDRVGDLQAGIYSNLRDQNIKNGMDPQAAQAAAAHIANRFAGALPMESMGDMARKMANLTMFSRSFTIGNLGVMKDMLKGMPSDVMAQLTRDVGESAANAASKMVQRKAIAAFAMDIGLMYAGNSLLQDIFKRLRGDKTLGQIGQGYVDRFHKLMQKFNESPWDLLNIPADLQSLSSTSTNEPGKENRILFSKDPKTGTDTYMRLPTGKIGEEFLGWVTSPLDMIHRKTSQLAGPIMDVFHNEDYFGHPIYDKDARGLAGATENVGKVVRHFMEAQIPEDSIVSAYRALTGSGKDADWMKAAGPMVGLTFSHGYPGGPEAGILAAASRRQEASISAALPEVKKAVESDDEDKAKDIMDDLGMTPRQQQSIINHYRNPEDKVNPRSLIRFERIATPEEKELMNNQREGAE